MRPNPKNIQPYLLNIILIWAIISLYKTLPYYKNFLRPEAQTTLFYFAIAYTIIALPYYLLKEQKQKSKGEEIINLIYKTITFKFQDITKKEKIQFLFILVKIFFTPIMINFTLNNYFYLKENLSTLVNLSSLFTIDGFNLIIFPLALGLLFFVDTLWFAFGYLAEAGFLKNKIRSVEPTFLGWFVALICYPPFNSYAVNGVNLFGFSIRGIDWFANDHVLYSTGMTTFIFRIAIVVLLGIYVSATLALGTKCSNLTNRGIISRGPYKYVRHPAYISKNLSWWLTIIPVFSLPAIISASAWSLIYHLRAVTEERHLSKDEDYLTYKTKVKYRYIPGVY